MQFAIWMLVFSIIYFLSTDFTKGLSGDSLFRGFNLPALLSMLLFGFYGLLVVLFIKFLDSLSKFVMSLCAIVVTSIFDVLLFQTRILPVQKFAMGFILLAAFVFKIGSSSVKKNETEETQSLVNKTQTKEG